MRNFWLSVVCIYGLIGVTMAAYSAPESLISLSQAKLSVIWFLPETSKARINAILAEGHFSLATLYAQLEYLSYGLILIGAALGFWWGNNTLEFKKRLPLRPLALLAISLLVLYGLNELLQHAVNMIAEKGVQVKLGLSAMPIYWLVGLIASAAFTAHYVMLAAHDTAITLRVHFSRISLNERA